MVCAFRAVWLASKVSSYLWLRSDTIRDATLTCARKPTWVSLIYHTEPTTKKCKKRKTEIRKQICSEITVNSLGNPCSESWRRKRKGCSGKDLQKRKVMFAQRFSTRWTRRRVCRRSRRCLSGSRCRCVPEEWLSPPTAAPPVALYWRPGLARGLPASQVGTVRF